MERVGFFAGDQADLIEAFDQQVQGKKRVEGLELAPALTDAGIGSGIRRIQAMNRIDIPHYWRAVIRSGTRKAGPIVSLLPPRDQAPGDAAEPLRQARVRAPEMAPAIESFDCLFPPGTPTATVVELAVAAVRAFGYTGELQWTVRKRGLLPR